MGTKYGLTLFKQYHKIYFCAIRIVSMSAILILAKNYKLLESNSLTEKTKEHNQTNCRHHAYNEHS